MRECSRRGIWRVVAMLLAVLLLVESLPLNVLAAPLRRYGTAGSRGEPSEQAQIPCGDFGCARVMGATAHVCHGACKVLTPQPPTAGKVDEGQN